MNKAILAIGLLVFLALAALLVGVYGFNGGEASAQETITNTSATGIVVTGEGTVRAKPDVAKVQLGVETRNADLGEAQSENADRMDRIMKAVRGLGVEEKDIQTVRYNMYPEMTYQEGKAPRVTGYVVTNVVVISVHDIEKTGDVLDKAVAAGSNISEGISFTIDDPAALREQAREKAMADAEAKAKQLAELGGVSLGRPVSISESLGGYPPQPMMLDRAVAAEAAGEMPQTPISAGEMEISITVNVSYSIQ